VTYKPSATEGGLEADGPHGVVACGEGENHGAGATRSTTRSDGNNDMDDRPEDAIEGGPNIGGRVAKGGAGS
jgi:hypothetical protein